jgi:hypothetical protein
MALCSVAAAVIGVAGGPESASAATQPVRLVWVRGTNAESCSDGPTIANAVSARLGESVFSDAAQMTIEGFIERDAGRWTARIFVRTASGNLVGSREMSSDAAGCAPIESAVTLAIALAIDPDAALRSPGPPPTGRTPPSPTLLPPAAASCPPCPAASGPAPTPCPAPPLCPVATPRAGDDVRRPATSSTVTLRGVLAGGLLPSASPGVEVAGRLPVWGALQVAAGAILLPEVRTAEADLGFGLTAVWAGACADAWSGRWGAASLCAAAMLGAIHAVVYVLEPTTPGQQLWGGASVTPAIRVRIAGPLVAEAGGELVVPATRQQFTVGGRTGAAFQEPPVAGVGFLGLGLSIP